MLSGNEEKKIQEQEKIDICVGIDEVGRGAWAGPMYFGYFVYLFGDNIIDGVNDSKKLSISKRQKIFDQLKSTERGGYLSVTVKCINKYGLKKAMNEGLVSLVGKIRDIYSKYNILFLIDGRFSGNWTEDIRFVDKGDAKYYSIAAASIFAKVSRDNLMKQLSEKYPKYGFENHVGYGTKKHREAIAKFGVLPMHRITYKPIERFLRHQ